MKTCTITDSDLNALTEGQIDAKFTAGGFSMGLVPFILGNQPKAVKTRVLADGSKVWTFTEDD